MTAIDLMAKRLLSLQDRPACARLQATAIALACLGLYSQPHSGIEIDLDLLIATRDELLATGVFPLLTHKACKSAFIGGLAIYESGGRITEGVLK